MDKFRPYVNFIVTFLPFVLLFGLFVGISAAALKIGFGVFILFALIELVYWFRNRS